MRTRYKIFFNILFMSVLGLFVFIGCDDHEPEPTIADTSNMDEKQKQKIRDLEEEKSKLDSIIYQENMNIISYESQKPLQPKKTLVNDLKKVMTLEPLHNAIWKVKTLDEKLAESHIKKSDAEVKVKQIEKKIDTLVQESQKTCFPGATQILLANGEYKEISKIEPGEYVLAYDIAKDTLVHSPVKHVYVDDNNHYYTINNAIKATAYERFLSKEGWKKIRELRVGDEIFNGNSYEVVKKIEKVQQPLTVYNLNIDSSHNFFVSNGKEDMSLLVHNSDHGGGSSGGGK